MNKMMLYINILLISIVFLSCSLDAEKFKEDYSGLEIHRALALEEWLNENEQKDSSKLRDDFSLIFTIPDSINRNDNCIKYINKNKKIPDYIVKALIESYSCPMMTVGEFFIANQDIKDSLKIITYDKSPEYIYIGYDKYYNSRFRFFTGSGLWIFKYGFLWESATI